MKILLNNDKDFVKCDNIVALMEQQPTTEINAQ